jgi:hypothetical protein
MDTQSIDRVGGRASMGVRWYSKYDILGTEYEYWCFTEFMCLLLGLGIIRNGLSKITVENTCGFL